MNRSKKIRRKKRGGGRSELGKGRERGKGGGLGSKESGEKTEKGGNKCGGTAGCEE